MLLLVANALFFMGFQVLLPTLPVYALKLGGGEVAAGLVMGLFSASAVLVRPFVGWALDAHGRRVLLSAGTAVCIGAALGYWRTTGVILLLALRIVHGVGFGLANTAGSTVASDMVPRGRLGEGMGFFTLTMSLPLAVAPVLGIALIAGGSFGGLFAVSAVLTLVSLVLTLVLRVPRHEHRPAPFSLGALVERTSIFPAAVCFLVTLTYGPIVTFISLYGEERRIVNAGLFFTVYALVLTVARPLSGRLSDRIGYERASAGGLVFLSAGLLVLAGAGNLALFLLAAVVYGVGFGTVQPSLQALVIHRVPAARRGAATAAFFLAFDLGVGAGSTIAGFLVGPLSLGAVYLTTAVFPVAALGLLRAGDRRGQERSGELPA